MKKLLSILLVSCLCLSIVGCGKNVDNSAKEEVVAEEVTDSTEDAVSDEIVEEVLEDVENAEVEETKSLIEKHGRIKNIVDTIGYKEILTYLESGKTMARFTLPH